MQLFALISVTAACLLIVTMLMLDLTGIVRRRPGMRLLFTGFLLLSGAELIIALIQEWSAPHAWHHAADLIVLAMAAAGIAMTLVGTRVVTRNRDVARRPE